MKRRVGSRGPVKDQRPTKRRPRKARVAPTPGDDLREQVASLTRELREARAHQAATGEILASLTESITDAKPVFDAIVRSGLNLFPDAVVTISLPDHGLIKLGAIGGTDKAGVEALRGRFPMPLSHDFITGTAILDRREIDIADAHEPPRELRAGAKNLLAGGYRAMPYCTAYVRTPKRYCAIRHSDTSPKFSGLWDAPAP